MTATTATRTRTARKVLGSLGVLGAAAAVAGMGTFGTFTDSTAPLNASVSSGTLDINLAAGDTGGTLAVSATNVVPGDSIARSVTLTNDGTTALSSIALSSTASTTNLLSTDATNGLQLAVDSCSVAWTKAANASVYTCSGTKKSVLAASPAVQSSTPLSGLNSMAAKTTDYLVVTVSLPTTAGNTFQNLSNTLSVSFTGSQATGTNR
jgi:Camelysin metallo-endopeptidase